MNPVQSVEALAQADHDSDEVDKQSPCLTVAEALALPALCGPREMQRLWHISASQFHRNNRQGSYDRFKVVPGIGPRQFSGVLLGRWLSGEPLMMPSFGRRGRR